MAAVPLAEPDLRVSGAPGRHVLIRADSRKVRYAPVFDLVVTSPPFFHPTNRSRAHGTTIGGHDLAKYVTQVANVLSLAATALRPNGVLCFVKTDIWSATRHFPLGALIAGALERQGLLLRAHWIWERHTFFTPYSPSIANVYILSAGRFARPSFCGLIRDAVVTQSGRMPHTFVPLLFARLIELLAPAAGMVLDPFAGTGSAIEGAARAGRWCVGIEISSRQLVRARRLLAERQDVRFDNSDPCTAQIGESEYRTTKGRTA